MTLPMLAPCQSIRRLTGTVLLPDGKPAQGAVVKLESQSGEIRTALSTASGSFQFSSLLTDTDYQVLARLGEMQSEKARWSRWSSRKERDVILRLRVRRTAGSSRSDQFRVGSSGHSSKPALIVRESCQDGGFGTFDLL
jgi:Carboxypeptidase regulatory-like domain